MKILFVVDAFRGGAGNVIQILACEFRNRGYDCTILITNGTQANPKYDLSGIQIIDLNLEKEAAPKNPIDRIVKYRRILKRLFKKEQPDVIISFLTVLNIMCCLSRDEDTKLIISERLDPTKVEVRKYWRFLRLVEYGKADKLVVQCSSFVGFAHGKFEKMTEVIGNPIIEPHIYHQVKEKEVVTFISMGRLEKQKNFPWMFEQMAAIHERVPNSRLVIYGDGSQHDTLVEIINRMNAQEYIKLVGYTDNPHQVLSEADIYLMTSDYEGFPNALSEAMAVGLPSISRKYSEGIRDLVKDDDNGFLVELNDKDSFIERAVQLATNTQMRESISESAKRVSKYFGVQRVADLWENLLN